MLFSFVLYLELEKIRKLKIPKAHEDQCCRFCLGQATEDGLNRMIWEISASLKEIKLSGTLPSGEALRTLKCLHLLLSSGRN